MTTRSREMDRRGRAPDGRRVTLSGRAGGVSPGKVTAVSLCSRFQLLRGGKSCKPN